VSEKNQTSDQTKMISNESPWDKGHSINVLRQVAAGITSTVTDYDLLPVDAGGVPAEWVIAEGVPDDAPVGLYFHGGAYLCGTPAQYRNATVGLSRSAQLRVLCVDYRLAPENPHPAAFVDALMAYRWLLDRPDVLPAKLVVMGDSAGSSIAVSVVMDALSHALPAPACIIANSPFADLALASASLNDPARNVAQPDKTTVEWLARTYLDADAPQSLSATDPQHSPVYRDLSGLPPLLVQTAGLDNLQHDGVRLAAQAIRYDVDTRYTEYPTAGHIWIVLQTPDQDPNVATAFAEINDFVDLHLKRE
jgi:monoterpene epsilon-lactone hydrolase